jgi:hypothetical protein
LIIAVINSAIPITISIPAPPIEIHFRNKGALLRSQPVAPPSSSIGDRAVPKPNKTAKLTLPTGVEKGNEYIKSAINGGHRISPLLKPSEKARKSNPNLPVFPCATEVLLFGRLHSHGDLNFRRMLAPIIIVTMLKVIEE